MKTITTIKVFILKEHYKDNHKFYVLKYNNVVKLCVMAKLMDIDKFITECAEYLEQKESEGIECTMINRIP